MNILPSFLQLGADKIQTRAEKVMPKEYGIDFSTGQMTGKVVEGIEAVKVWIWLCLHTERYRYPLYSWDYGTSLEQYIGQSLSEEFINTDCEDEIAEAMLINPYISEIRDFKAELTGDQLHISFAAVTDFGKIEVDTDV